MRIHADLTERAVVDANGLPWTPSPLPGVERRMLERDGAEVARATSIVRYAQGSRFDPHTHDGGEEFLVLEGVFSDETGDFPQGMYVRNPVGSRHTPHSGPGTTILVKLRQFDPEDQHFVRIDTTRTAWHPRPDAGVETMPLHAWGSESVTLLRLAAGARLSAQDFPGGREVFVLSGAVEIADETYGTWTWVREPPGHHAGIASAGGATVFQKTGHLPQTRRG